MSFKTGCGCGTCQRRTVKEANYEQAEQQAALGVRVKALQRQVSPTRAEVIADRLTELSGAEEALLAQLQQCRQLRMSCKALNLEINHGQNGADYVGEHRIEGVEKSASGLLRKVAQEREKLLAALCDPRTGADPSHELCRDFSCRR